MASKSVALITMSTRGTRVGPAVAEFVKNIIEKPLAADEISIASVDLVKFNLPVYNEHVAPASTSFPINISLLILPIYLCAFKKERNLEKKIGNHI